MIFTIILLTILILLFMMNNRVNRYNENYTSISKNIDNDNRPTIHSNIENEYILPPLNYFTLQEPDYFFYDTDIVNSEAANYAIENNMSDNNNNMNTDNANIINHQPNTDILFGIDNYFRYYPSPSQNTQPSIPDY